MLITLISVVLLAALFWGLFEFFKNMTLKDFKLGSAIICALLFSAITLFVIVQLF